MWGLGVTVVFWALGLVFVGNATGTSHQGAQEARQHAWGLYRSSLLLALASQITFPATGRHPAHTSQVSGRNTEMPSTSQCAELPCTPLEWLTSAAPRNYTLPRLPSRLT